MIPKTTSSLNCPSESFAYPRTAFRRVRVRHRHAIGKCFCRKGNGGDDDWFPPL